MVCIYTDTTMDCYLTVKKKRNDAIYSNIDGCKDYHTKWCKLEKDKYFIIHLYVESKKWYKWT